MKQKPRIGVSQCLLGDAVRYDGDSKPNKLIVEQLSQLFELVAVCPEVEAGLGIPRPPVQSTGSISSPQFTGRDDASINITEIMVEYCSRKIQTLNDLNGFIFKSRSPSCGLNSTPVFVDDKCITEHARGVFAHALCDVYPDLPVIEETELESGLDNFVDAVILYANT